MFCKKNELKKESSLIGKTWSFNLYIESSNLFSPEKKYIFYYKSIIYLQGMWWPSLVYGVILEILSMFSAASSNLAPSELIKKY